MCILHRISPICNNILFTYQLINKSSAVAEMGDRLTTIDMAEKWESAVRELGPHLTLCRPVEAYLSNKWHLDLSSHLATIDMGRMLGGGRDCARLGGAGSGSTSNTMWLGPRGTSCLTKWHLNLSNRLATIHQHCRQTEQTDSPIA